MDLSAPAGHPPEGQKGDGPADASRSGPSLPLRCYPRHLLKQLPRTSFYPDATREELLAEAERLRAVVAEAYPSWMTVEAERQVTR